MKSTVVSPGPHAPRRFRHLLQEELARRCHANPQYSLRAFARDLDCDHSTLSQLLRGRRRLTERMLRALSARLGLDAETVDAFAALEERLGGPVGDGGTLQVVEQLTADALAVLRGPEHHALLELTHLDAFRADVRWIARVLGLTTDVVLLAVQRLVRLGMLAMEGPRWVDCSGHATTVLGEGGWRTVRQLGERVRRLAEARQPDERAGRESSSTTLAVDSARLPEALELLARARRDVLALLAGPGPRDAVYHLEIALFPLTRPSAPPHLPETDP